MTKSSVKHITFNLVKELHNNKICNVSCLGLEFSFANNKRRADVMVVSNDELIAFEIKSDYDNLTRLESQIKDYNSLFDYTYIVTTNKYLDNIIKNNIYKNVGIILYEKNNIVIKRKPLKNQKIKEEYLISLLDSNIDFCKENIKSNVIETIKNKLTPVYENFTTNFVPPYDDTYLIDFKMSKQKLSY
jgi:hypothetical protein